MKLNIKNNITWVIHIKIISIVMKYRTYNGYIMAKNKLLLDL